MALGGEKKGGEAVIADLARASVGSGNVAIIRVTAGIGITPETFPPKHAYIAQVNTIHVNGV